MGRKKSDRRVARTRRALSEALTGLVLEKRFDSITVQDVIGRADVGRSTFYAHFRDKEDLFLSAWRGLLDWFVSRIEWEKAGEGCFVPVRELFHHAQEFQPFYMALARSRKTDFLFKTGLAYLTGGIGRALTSFLADKPEPSIPVAIMSHYLAGETLGLLRWWLEHGRPYPPERMDEIFHGLVTPGFRSALGVGVGAK